MADKKTAKDAKVRGGNEKSSGKGGGKSAASGVDPRGVAKNARATGADPSPDSRKRGETGHASR